MFFLSFFCRYYIFYLFISKRNPLDELLTVHWVHVCLRVRNESHLDKFWIVCLPPRNQKWAKSNSIMDIYVLCYIEEPEAHFFVRTFSEIFWRIVKYHSREYWSSIANSVHYDHKRKDKFDETLGLSSTIFFNLVDLRYIYFFPFHVIGGQIFWNNNTNTGLKIKTWEILKICILILNTHDLFTSDNLTDT